MMIFLILLLSSGLIFIAATSFTRNESLCYQPSKYVIPMHYDIMLSTFIEGNIFYVEYNISISILKKTQHIYLHSEQLCINNIVLFTNLEKYHEYDTIYKPTYYIKEDTIDISFMDELSPGNYILNIKYLGTAARGFRTFDVKKTAWIATTHFQIINARRLSPCRDQQDFLLEATFNISIGCKQCTALSNMPLRNTEKNENILWRHFDTTPVMLPYLATMIVSNYLFLHDHITQIINMWCRDESRFHIKFAVHVADLITWFLDYEWRYWYTLKSKVDHVAIPNFHDKDMIVFGLVLYRETDIIYDKNLYPIAQKIEVAQLVGRKVTQQWFNKMMNNPLISDFWFKKGLITFFATYAVSEMFRDYRIMNLFVVQNQHYSFNLDGDYYMWPSNSQVNSSLEIPNSVRAPFILRMMQHILTEEIFLRTIGIYAYDIESHDISFVNLAKLVASTMNPNITQQLTRMEDWALEKHCPLIKVVYNDTEIMSEAYVSIQYIDTLKIDCLPVTFTTEESLDFNNFTHHMLCVSRDLKLSLPVSLKQYGWIIFNIQQIGYYRVNYNDKNWLRISNYLNSDDYTKIHVLNRAQIIDDAFNLMIAGHLHSYIFWNIISYLDQEEDYIAWYPLFKALEYICSTFPVLKEKIGYFTSRVRYALHKLLERIKYEETDDIDKLRICLRQEAARWACLLDDITCKREANDKLKQHLQDPAKHRLLPWWKKWTYCKGLIINTNQTTWELVYAIGFRKSDTKFLEYLACTEDTDMINNYLIYESNSKKEDQYLFNSFLYIITKHANNQTILMDILNYIFLNIRPKHVDVTAALIIIINNVYSVNLNKEINKYVQWIKYNTDLINGMKEKDSIMMKSDKVESKISIRHYQIERQKQYYDRFFLQRN